MRSAEKSAQAGDKRPDNITSDIPNQMTISAATERKPQNTIQRLVFPERHKIV